MVDGVGWVDRPWPWAVHGHGLSMVHGHGQSIWETYNLLFDIILRLSEALVCFRASRANFLRSFFCIRTMGNVELIC